MGFFDAGAAGLAIAREFAGIEARVAVIESGDLVFRQVAQLLPDDVSQYTHRPARSRHRAA